MGRVRALPRHRSHLATTGREATSPVRVRDSLSHHRKSYRNLTHIREDKYSRLSKEGSHITGLFRTYGIKETADSPVIQSRVPRISSELANLIEGEYQLDDLTHQNRAEFLFGLSTSIKALDDIGWIEHTSDWDWWLRFEKNDGTFVGDTWEDIEDDEDQTVYSDSFSLSFTKDEFQFAEDPKYYANLEVIVHLFGAYTEDPPSVRVKIGDIKAVVFSQR